MNDDPKEPAEAKDSEPAGEASLPERHYYYRMPAEWEPHWATWLSWPHNLETWPDNLEAAERIFAEMASELSQGERVEILVRDEEMEAHARDLIVKRDGTVGENLNFHHIPTNDAWIRDHGPTFVEEIYVIDGSRRQVLLDWGYNAWGGKYPPWEDDNAVPLRIGEKHDWLVLQPGMVLEGGAIEPNGEGVLLTTEACLLNPNRNPHMTRDQIEAMLCRWLGVRKVLWLGEGIVGDDTDGHVDDITRFVSPDTVVTAVEEDPADANHEPLRENRDRLRHLTDAENHPFQVIELPMPGPVDRGNGRLPASYANFYIGNEVVLVPIFGHDNDRRALEILGEIWPDRRIKGIEATDLVVGLGAFHCVTQQQPRLSALK